MVGIINCIVDLMQKIDNGVKFITLHNQYDNPALNFAAT